MFSRCVWHVPWCLGVGVRLYLQVQQSTETHRHHEWGGKWLPAPTELVEDRTEGEMGTGRAS